MLVRAFRSRQRGRWIPVVALATFAITASHPRTLRAQERSDSLPKTHTVKRGDTLWDISKTYLSDPFLWPEIYRLNTDLIQDPHWIYPGEVLKLPGPMAKVVAIVPPPTEQPVAPTSIPAAPPAFAPPTKGLVQTSAGQIAPAGAVRSGEYAAAPWVDDRGGPRGSGFIMQAVDLPGIASQDHSRMNLYDRVLIAPPVGAIAPERELYLAYRLGPLIEGFGQIVIPTGIVEITRAPRNGEAAIARVVKMFGEVLQGQRVIPYDSSGAMVVGRASPVSNGPAGKVRWIKSEPVLPSLQDYIVVDIARSAGIATGDQIDLYKPRQPAAEGSDFAIPEVWIAQALVLRVTAFGATAIITSHEQPKIEDGTAARVAAKMP